MNFMKRILLFIVLFQSAFVYAQTNSLNFNICFNKEPIALNKKYLTASKDTIELSLVKIYISNIIFKTKFNKLENTNESYYLLNCDDSNHIKIPINNIQNVDSIFFDIGIDSISNYNAAFTKALDPINGMYWTWQSGFINFKIEGKINSKNNIEYHIGGFAYPNNALQKLAFAVPKNENNIFVNIDLYNFFNSIEKNFPYAIMSPNANAVAISRLLKISTEVENK